jgi:hypothetical protein
MLSSMSSPWRDVARALPGGVGVALRLLMRRLSLGLLGGAMVLCAAAAQAETLGDVDVLTQGDDVVVRLSFNANVRFVLLAPTTPAANYQVSWEIVSADLAVANQATDEFRRVPAQLGLPEIRLTYPVDRTQHMKKLQVSLAASASMKARQGPSSRSIDLVFLGMAAPAVAPATAPAPVPAPSAADPRHFTIALVRLPMSDIDKAPAIPREFNGYEAFTTSAMVAGVPMVELDLGRFASAEAATPVFDALRARFPEARIVDIDHPDAIVASAPAPAGASVQAPVPPVPPVPVAVVAAPVEVAPAGPVAQAPAMPAPMVVAGLDTGLDPVAARAADLMKRARTALAAHAYEDAVGLLNQLLLLPPNAQSTEAQEWIGVAWERAGDLARARVEYELYLRLYPTGDGADRVSQRLASMDGPGGAVAQAPGAASGSAAGTGPAASKRGWKYSGDVAQYYYGGKARSQSLTTVSAGINHSTLSKTTESALLTNLDLSARKTDEDTDITGVIRGTQSLNLSAKSHAQSIMNAAYIDYQRTESGLGVRLGRQSAINGGLLGLFDGASVTYPVSPAWKVDLMGGAPANPLVSVPQERLLAGMVEADGLAEHWGGDLYVIDQTTQGITNRRAVGAELRYSGESGSLYSLVDGDLLFRKLNAVSLQGSYLAPGNVNVTLLLDSRNAPTLAMTNALITSGASSLKQLLQNESLAQIRADAQKTTARARQAMLSVSRPFGAQWQVGADLRYSAIGALPEVNDFQATPATGAQIGGSLQLTGSNLYSAHDVDNFGLSVLSAPTFKGAQFSWSNLTSLRGGDWTLEPSMSWYTQHESTGGRTNRADLGLRNSYRLSSRASVTEECLFEHSQTQGPLGHDTTNSVFFYIGYRYDLR